MAKYFRKGVNEMKNFNLRLKALRKDKKKTQQNIADLLKIRRSTYGEYERGKILPPMDKIKTLAEYFDVSVDYLLGAKNEAPEELELIDVYKQLKIALNHLKRNQNNLIFDGKKLNDESRKILIQSLENGVKMAQIIKENKND